VELAIFTRHAESVYNVAGCVNGDHTVAVPLSAHGVSQARALATQLARFEIEACVHTRFRRTIETARLALRDIAPHAVFVREARLDDIRCGAMEGWPVREDHAWRSIRGRDRAPRGGESIRDAALRIARGLRFVASRPERTVAVVSHELIVRYALNAACDGEDIARPWRAIPHATPFVMERHEVMRAADRIESLASGEWGRAIPDALANGG
jgi:broad specificity phosphatase PhoE